MATKRLYQLEDERITSNSIAHQKSDNEYINLKEYLNPTVLYNNTSGSNSNITLSDSAVNYEYIEIFFRSNDNTYNSVKIYEPNGKSISLIAQYNNGSNIVWFKITIVTISGTSITRGNAVDGKLISNSSAFVGSTSNIYITRVVGYK